MLSDLTFNGCDDLVCYLPDTKALHICRWFFFFSVREDPANAVVPRKIGIRFIQLRINVRSAIFIRQCQDKFTPVKLILIRIDNYSLVPPFWKQHIPVRPPVTSL